MDLNRIGILSSNLLKPNQISSDEVLVWGTFILVFVILIVSIVWGALARKKRREALQQLSTEIGFSFTPEDKEFNIQLQSGTQFDLFSRGHSRKANNLLQGQRREAKVVLFDYKYTTGGGRSSQTHQQTAVLFNLEQPDLTQLSLKPRGLWDKVAVKLGQKEIDFSTAAEFTKRYLVKGSDEAAIHRIFNTSVVAFFEEQQGLSMEANEKQLLFYRQNKRVKPEELQAFLEKGAQLLALMRKPSYNFSFPS
jgi:hypothetical protein